MLPRVLVLGPWGMWDLIPLTRDRTCTQCIGRQSLSHWTVREAPCLFLASKQWNNSHVIAILHRSHFLERVCYWSCVLCMCAQSCLTLGPQGLQSTSLSRSREWKGKLGVKWGRISRPNLECPQDKGRACTSPRTLFVAPEVVATAVMVRASEENLEMKTGDVIGLVKGAENRKEMDKSDVNLMATIHLLKWHVIVFFFLLFFSFYPFVHNILGSSLLSTD